MVQWSRLPNPPDALPAGSHEDGTAGRREHEGHGADFFIKKDIHQLLKQEPLIDTILLACTHYPLLKERIEKHLPAHVKLLSQPDIVADSLQDYLLRHSEIESKISKTRSRTFYTTDAAGDFNARASIFFGEAVKALHLDL